MFNFIYNIIINIIQYRERVRDVPRYNRGSEDDIYKFRFFRVFLPAHNDSIN